MKDLDPLLRDDARTAIADNGFSTRVVAALPARARAHGPWLRPALIFGSAAIGSAAAAFLAPGGGSLLEGFADLVQLRVLTPGAITALAMGGALLASALVLAIDSE